MRKRAWQWASLAIAACAAIAIVAGLFGLGAVPVFFAKLFLLGVAASVAFLGVGRFVVGEQRIRRAYFGLVAVVATTFICLVAAEFVVRFVFADVTTTAENASYFSNRYWAGNPPQKNSLGFREREFATPHSPGTFRIGVVGDSFTYGQGIAEDARVSNLLEKRLTGDHHSFEVLNFGISGAETADELLTLTRFVLPSRPDFVILQWFVNDIDDHKEVPREKPARLLPSETLSRVLQQRSALYYLVEQQYRRLRQSRSAEDLKFDPNSAKASNYRDLLTRFIQTVRSANVPIAMVIYPQLHEVDGSAAKYPQKELIDFVVNVCESQGATCIDLRTVFAPVSPAVKLWANRLDSHPSALANELATNALVERLGAQWKCLQERGDCASTAL